METRETITLDAQAQQRLPVLIRVLAGKRARHSRLDQPRPWRGTDLARPGAPAPDYTLAMVRPVANRPAASILGKLEPAVVAVLATPVGPLHVAATGEGIVGLELRTTDEAFAASVGSRTRRAAVHATDDAATPAARAHLAALEREVDEHVAGTRDAFDVPIVLEGVADWDRRVLDGVRTIPRGTTASYGEVARRIGSPGAARAVGGAVGRNPIGLLIPCHRVIAGDGTLGGYGGSWFGSREELLGLKERLLELEGVEPPPRSQVRR